MRRQSTDAPCEFPECGRKIKAHGLCIGHYTQQRRGISLFPLNSTKRRDGTPPVIEWDEVPCPNPDLKGPCHAFRGSKNRSGYGIVSFDNRRMLVHRYVWEHKKGLIEDRKVIDHKCRNRACINIDHLRVVTRTVNSTENVEGTAWQLNAVKTHCPKGHPYDEENTSFNGKGGRVCRICRKATALRYYYRKRKVTNGPSQNLQSRLF